MAKKLTRGEIIVLSKELKAKNDVNLNPKEQCQIDNVGRCGVCTDTGKFIECAK